MIALSRATTGFPSCTADDTSSEMRNMESRKQRSIYNTPCVVHVCVLYRVAHKMDYDISLPTTCIYHTNADNFYLQNQNINRNVHTSLQWPKPVVFDSCFRNCPIARLIKSIRYKFFIYDVINMNSVEEIHSVGRPTINNVETSYFTQLKICYLNINVSMSVGRLDCLQL